MLRPLAASLVAVIVVLVMAPLAASAVSGHAGPIRTLAVAPDGKRALTGGFDYSVILWDLSAGMPMRRMVGHDAPVDAVAFLSADRAVSAGDDASLIVWNLTDGTAVARWRAHSGKIAALAVAPGGGTVASAGWDRKIALWDVTTGRPQIITGHDANINALAFSPDGGLLASGDYGGTIMLWQVPGGRPIGSLPGNGFPVNALQFAPDGKLLAALADDTVRVLDPGRKREILRYRGHSDPVVSLAVSHDGTLAASGSSRGAVDVWQVATGETRRSLYATPGPAWALAFLPGDRRLLTAGADGKLREWAVVPTDQLTSGELPSGEVTGGGWPGGAPAIAQPPPPTGRGAMLFRKCQACHDFDPADHAKAGPTFWHLIGRRAGAVAGYPYSPALKDSGLVWDEATIDRLFADGPGIVAPGSKMPLQRMPSAEDRADLIKYLKRHATAGKRVE